MKKKKRLFRSKEVLLVKVFILKQLCCPLWRIYSFTIICQLKNDTIIGYRAYDDIVVVNGCAVLSVTICIHKHYLNI